MQQMEYKTRYRTLWAPGRGALGRAARRLGALLAAACLAAQLALPAGAQFEDNTVSEAPDGEEVVSSQEEVGPYGPYGGTYSGPSPASPAQKRATYTPPRLEAAPTAAGTGSWTDAGNYDTSWFLSHTGEGFGTESNPYIIHNAQELAGLAVMVNQGSAFEGIYIKLDEAASDTDFDLSAHQWVPIGHYDNYGPLSRPFCGIFDGNNKHITGLTVEDSLTLSSTLTDYYNYGLFGFASNPSDPTKDPGQIKNLSLAVNISVKATGSTNTLELSMGGLAGVLGTVDAVYTISNCRVTGVISGEADMRNQRQRLGGLVGFQTSHSSYLQFEGCSSAVQVTGIDSSAERALAVNLGGFIGSALRFQFINCGFSGAVLGDAHSAGGFGGDAGGMGNLIADSVSSGTVEARERAGGFFGSTGNVKSTDCTFSGSVTVGDIGPQADAPRPQVGGFAGGLYTVDIDGFSMTGQVRGGEKAFVGGVGGVCHFTADDALVIRNTFCSDTAAIAGGKEARVGGLIGEASNSQLLNSYVTAAVTGGTGASVGGLSGVSQAGKIHNCYFGGTINSTPGYKGGLVGVHQLVPTTSTYGSALSMVGAYWLDSAAGDACGFSDAGTDTIYEEEVYARSEENMRDRTKMLELLNNVAGYHNADKPHEPPYLGWNLKRNVNKDFPMFSQDNPTVSLKSPVGDSVSIGSSGLVLQFSKPVKPIAGKKVFVLVGDVTYEADASLATIDATGKEATFPLGAFKNGSVELVLDYDLEYTVRLEYNAFLGRDQGFSVIDDGTMGFHTQVEPDVPPGEYPLTVRAEDEAGGKVRIGDGAFAAIATASLPEGGQAQLSAQPESGWTFVGWTVAGGGILADDEAAQTTLTMPAGAVEVTAHFSSESYTLTVQAGPGGLITLGGSGDGEEITRLGSSTGYKGTGNESDVTIGATIGATWLGPAALRAQLAPAGGQEVPDTAAPSASAAPDATAAMDDMAAMDTPVPLAQSPATLGASGDLAAASFTATASGVFPAGARVHIGAEPAEGYRFSRWVSAAGGSFEYASSSYTRFTMPANHVTITAEFVPIDEPEPEDTYSLVLSAQAGGRIVQGSSGSYKEGERVAIGAQADVGYRFTGWQNPQGGALENAAAQSTTFTMPANDCTVTACFERTIEPPPSNSIVLEGRAGSNGWIDPDGRVTVAAGSNKTFTFGPDSDYEISRVTVDGHEVDYEDEDGREGSYTFTNVQEDHVIRVTFKERRSKSRKADTPQKEAVDKGNPGTGGGPPPAGLPPLPPPGSPAAIK